MYQYEDDMSDKKINKSAQMAFSTVADEDKLIESGYPINNSSNSAKIKPPMPMSPIAASATVINLILATGPFR